MPGASIKKAEKLGTVAPRVCSAKALGASTASGAMLDLEIKWASDLKLELEVGVAGMPLSAAEGAASLQQQGLNFLCSV